MSNLYPWQQPYVPSMLQVFFKNTFVSNIDKLNSKTVIKISKLIFTYLEHKLIDPTVNI